MLIGKSSGSGAASSYGGPLKIFPSKLLKHQDFRFGQDSFLHSLLLIFYYVILPALAMSFWTSSGSPFDGSRMRVRAPAGHFDVQTLQPMHFSTSTTAIPSAIEREPNWQDPTQISQLEQRSASTRQT